MDDLIGILQYPLYSSYATLCKSRNAGHMDRGTRGANIHSEHLQHTLSFSLCHGSLQGINPTLPERLTGKQESKNKGMEGERRRARSRA